MQCKLLSNCTGRVHRGSTLALLPWNIQFLTFVLEKNAEKTDIQKSSTARKLSFGLLLSKKLLLCTYQKT